MDEINVKKPTDRRRLITTSAINVDNETLNKYTVHEQLRSWGWAAEAHSCNKYNNNKQESK